MKVETLLKAVTSILFGQAEQTELDNYGLVIGNIGIDRKEESTTIEFSREGVFVFSIVYYAPENGWTLLETDWDIPETYGGIDFTAHFFSKMVLIEAIMKWYYETQIAKM